MFGTRMRGGASTRRRCEHESCGTITYCQCWCCRRQKPASLTLPSFRSDQFLTYKDLERLGDVCVSCSTSFHGKFLQIKRFALVVVKFDFDATSCEPDVSAYVDEMHTHSHMHTCADVGVAAIVVATQFRKIKSVTRLMLTIAIAKFSFQFCPLPGCV